MTTDLGGDPMRKANLLMVFTLLTTLNAGCEPDDVEVRPVACTVIADPPKMVEGKDKIAANVRFRCESPGAEVLTIKLSLQKRKGEQWHNVASKTFTLKGRQTYARPLKYQSRAIDVGCAEGSYRTVVDWSRTSRKDTEGDNLVSGSMRDPCQPLLPVG